LNYPTTERCVRCASAAPPKPEAVPIETPQDDETPRRKPGPPEKYPWGADPFRAFYVHGRTRRTLENLARKAGKRYARKFSVRRVHHEQLRSVFQIVRVDVPTQPTNQTNQESNEHAATEPSGL
jgi:hypothetical protein